MYFNVPDINILSINSLSTSSPIYASWEQTTRILPPILTSLPLPPMERFKDVITPFIIPPARYIKAKRSIGTKRIWMNPFMESTTISPFPFILFPVPVETFKDARAVKMNNNITPSNVTPKNVWNITSLFRK